MKKLPLVLIILSVIFVYVEAQTKSVSKVKKTVAKPTKTATPKPVVALKTPTPAPTPIPTPIQVLPPAQTISLSKFEAEIFAELNAFRVNPQGYAKHLEDFLQTFDGKYFRNSAGVMLDSFEGKIPVVEAIATLKQAQPMSEFNLADGLIKAAADHSQDLVKNNRTGHRGTNGSMPNERVFIYGTVPNNEVYENISYGGKTAREVVLIMLIDDGTASRNHRKSLLNPKNKYVGLATGENKAGGAHCILVIAPGFADKK
ncbi:MAG: CAP domain-containing protein [Acidobacteriota bacterium]